MSDEPFAERQIGPYVLRGLLGRGGMGEVYEAFDTGKERVVALKLLSPALSHDEVFRERFRRESYAAARLHEPHVIPIHDFGDIDGRLYLDMRLVRGSDVRRILRTEGVFTPSRAVYIIEQVAAALDAAHYDGLIHRDVKPENVLVADGDFAYLADFGIARNFADEKLTSTQATVGTCQYMAPERLEDGEVGPAADVYSLTCVLFEMLTGAPPFRGTSLGQLVRQHLSEPPPAASSVLPGLPPALDAVIIRGLAKDPAERYASAGEFAEAARRALTGASQPPTGTAVMPVFDPNLASSYEPAAVVPPRVDTPPHQSVPQQQPNPTAMRHQTAQVYAPPRKSKATTATLVMLVIAVLALGGAVGVLLWKTDFRGGGGEATTTTAAPTTTTTAPITPVANADAQGFTGGGPRCSGLDRAVALGESENWQVVVCRALLGRLTLKAVGNGSSVDINGANESGGGYMATDRDGTVYDVSSERLLITQGGSTVTEERWSAYTRNG